MLYLFITALPRITNLTVNGFGHIRTVLQNQNVQIVCSLDPGYPPVAARLLGSSGKILSDLRDSNGSITHVYSAITCHDAGNIRCEANGAERNMSVTLLVQCKLCTCYVNISACVCIIFIDLKVHICIIFFN